MILWIKPCRSYVPKANICESAMALLYPVILTVCSLELGAGGGLVGLAVARGCRTTKKTIITDQLPMLSLMHRNIVLNSLEAKITAEILEWGTPTSTSIEKHFSNPESANGGRCPDVILAADCVYFEPAFPLLLQTMDEIVGPDTICYFCFKKRRKADWRFIKDMKKHFDVVDLEYDDKDQNTREGIYLYEVRRKSKQ